MLGWEKGLVCSRSPPGGFGVSPPQMSLAGTWGDLSEGALRRGNPEYLSILHVFAQAVHA